MKKKYKVTAITNDEAILRSKSGETTYLNLQELKQYNAKIKVGGIVEYDMLEGTPFSRGLTIDNKRIYYHTDQQLIEAGLKIK